VEAVAVEERMTATKFNDDSELGAALWQTR
jgi:hypothetical protein